MAVGSHRRSSWIMASTSCLVRMPSRSKSSTGAACSHMLEMASSATVEELLVVLRYSPKQWVRKLCPKLCP